jgi:hypothetical protein
MMINENKTCSSSRAQDNSYPSVHPSNSPWNIHTMPQANKKKREGENVKGDKRTAKWEAGLANRIRGFVCTFTEVCVTIDTYGKW